MRKTVIANLLVVLCLLLSACGGPNHKEEAKNLYEKYYGDNGSFHTALAKASTQPPKDWSKELLEWGRNNEKQFNSIAKSIEAEKVQKENEQLKSDLKAISVHMANFFRVASLEIEAHLNKTRLDPQTEAELKEARSNFKIRQFQYNYEIKNEYSKITTGKPIKVIGANNKNYIAYSASGVDIALTGIDTPKVIGNNPFSQAKPMGKFIVIEVVVKNNQKDAITVDSNCFKLIDNQKREYSVSVEAMTAIHMEKGNAKGFLTQLNPGMGTTFKFAFDVPADSHKSGFMLQARGGMSGGKVIMPMRIEEVPQMK